MYTLQNLTIIPLKGISLKNILFLAKKKYSALFKRKVRCIGCAAFFMSLSRCMYCEIPLRYGLLESYDDQLNI